MLKKKDVNEQIKSKKYGKLIKKENKEIKEISQNYTQKLKVNLSSSLKFITKKKNTKKEKNIINSIYLLNIKIISKNLKKYNSKPIIKNIMIINNLINCKSNHFLAVFKDYLITDYIEEFLRRIYLLKESKDRIPKLYNYYNNYLLFFCKPTFIDSFSNVIVKKFGENHAEYFYKINMQKKNKDKNKNKNKENNSEENNKDDNNKDLIKTIFTKSIKNTIENDNNNNEEYSIKNKKKEKILYDLENSLKHESIIKIDKNNKISEGNTLLLMINEIKENKKNENKRINLKKNISRNRNISNESYKNLYINNTFNNIIKNNLNNYQKKTINTHSNFKHIDSYKKIVNSPKMKKVPKFNSKKNIHKLSKNNFNSILVNINRNIHTNQNENIITNNNYKSPRNNIGKIKFPLSPLNINILNDKEIPKRSQPLTSRINKDKIKSINYIKIINRKKVNENFKILTTNNKNKKKFTFNKIKSLDSIDINSNELRYKQNNSCNKEIINYQPKSPKKKCRIIKYRNNNNNNDFSIKTTNYDLLTRYTTYNKTISSSTKNFGTKFKSVNSMKNLIKVNEIKINKKFIYKNIKNNKDIKNNKVLYSPPNKTIAINKYISYKRKNNLNVNINLKLN